MFFFVWIVSIYLFICYKVFVIPGSKVKTRLKEPGPGHQAPGAWTQPDPVVTRLGPVVTRAK